MGGEEEGSGVRELGTPLSTPSGEYGAKDFGGKD